MTQQSSDGVGDSGWIDLGHVLHDEMLVAGPSGQLAFTSSIRPIEPSRALSVTRMNMAVHVGSHIDAPNHFVVGGRSLDTFEVSTFVGPGVGIDVRRTGISPVSAAQLESTGADVRPGDIVLLCFGYGRHFGSPEYREHPYLTEDAADWLIGRGVRMVGMDILGPDLPEVARPPGFTWPIHQRLLSAEILIMENLSAALESLLGSRLEIVATPIRIRGADGGPCSPIARTVVV